MEAHFLLKREGFDVCSYGTGTHVKLPGPSLREPTVYELGTPYKHMFDYLRHKDPEFYKRNVILPMLKRNLAVKTTPQHWQENGPDEYFDAVFTFGEKLFDMVVEAEKWDDIVAWLSPHAHRCSTTSVISRMLVAASCYFMWQERNNRFFGKNARNVGAVRDVIVTKVRLKLLTMKFKNMSKAQKMIDNWKLPERIIV